MGMVTILYNYELQKRRVYQFTKHGVLIRFYDGIREAGRDLNLDHKNISACCNFKRNSCGGFMFSFSEHPTFYKGKFINHHQIHKL